MEPGIDLLQAGMDERSEAVWQAMRAGYRSGLMNEVFDLAGALMPPDMDQIEMLGEAEEMLMRADLGAVAGLLEEVLVPLARALAEEEVVEAMKSLLLAFKPAIAGAVAASGGDIAALREKLVSTGKSLLALRPVARAAAPAALRAASPHLEGFLRDKAGPAVGGAINAQCAGLNRLVESNPRAIPAFLQGVSETIDHEEMRKAASALFGIFLAHRPRPLKWLARETAALIRKRLAGTREGGA